MEWILLGTINLSCTTDTDILESIYLGLEIEDLTGVLILSHDITVIQWITSCQNTVKTTCHITLSAGTSNVMTTLVTKMQIFIKINKLWRR